MPLTSFHQQAAAIDCFSFTSQSQAQVVLDALPSDPYWLDHGDQNGVACDNEKAGTDILATAQANKAHKKKVPRSAPKAPPKNVIAKPVIISYVNINTDGVSLTYRENGDRRDVVSVLIGIDAPRPAGQYAQYRPGFEGGECYNAEALQDLRRRLPEGSTAYVEYGKSGGARQVAYVWIKDDKSSGYLLVNEILVCDGSAVAGDTSNDRDKSTQLPLNVTYEKVIQQAQSDAIQEKAGLWGACS